MRNLFFKLNGGRFLVELISLHGTQIANIVIPLLMVPILGKSLGAKAYGSYLVIQSLIIIASLIIEYGFTFSGTRLISKHIDDQVVQIQIVSKIIGAKVLLSILVVSLAVILAISQWQKFSLYEITIISIGALSLGWYPIWYFQGKGNLAKFATFDVIIKGLSVILTLVLVRDPVDLNIALLLSAAASFTSALFGNIKILSEIGKIKINFNDSIKMMIDEKDMAIYRILSSSIGNTSSLILSTFSNTATVAVYSGAEKLASGSRFFIMPFNQVFFTRVSRYGKNNIAKARKEFQTSLALLMLISFLIMTIGWIFAPFLVEAFLGKEFSSTAEILRYLIMITPIFVLGNTLSMQWMVPLGFDRQYNTIIATGAIISLALMILVVPKFGLLGMVIITGSVELLISIMMIIYLLKINLNPFSQNRNFQSETIVNQQEQQ
ncbi:oligosaccharide flippase family protein [Deinococcus sp. PEB2-63]